MVARMTVFRIPAAVTTTDEPVHWMSGERTDIWPNAQAATVACGGEGRSDYTQDKVTCPACLETIVRRRCLALEPSPGPLPRRCLLLAHSVDEQHDWEKDDDADTPNARTLLAQRLGADSYASTAQREALARRAAEEGQHPELVAELDTPSDVLPRRVPGEALREAEEAAVSEFEGEGGTPEPGEAVRPGASASPREVMETWTA